MSDPLPDSDEPPIALEPLPLDDWHRARGGRMVPFAGYDMPVQYEGVMPEHLWTRAHAGLFDVSHMGQLLLTADAPGTDVAAAVERLVPGDIAGLAAGRMRYSLLLAADGGILDDLMVTRRDDGIYIVVNGATKWDDIAHVHERLPDDVTLNHMDDQALLALQGPEAVVALQRLVPDVARLVFMSAGAFAIDGVAAWISRSGYTGEDGFEISIPAAEATRIATLLCDQPEVRPIGLGARDSLRLEAGLPLYGHDLDAETTPVMAGLGFALAKKRRWEGGYPGHDRIALELDGGVTQMRVGLIIDGRQPVREGARVLDAQGNQVGRVTSGGFSPTLGRPIAMAYVPPSLATQHAEVTLEQRGKLLQATVAAMPFVPHRYVRKGA